jgi:hypothetical protein
MDSSDVLSNQRSRSSRNSVSVDDEVQKLLRKTPANSGDLINKLRQKMNDEILINKIQKAYVDKHTQLLKKAQKFAQLVRAKYGDRNFPFHILLEKAYVFKVKHGLSNDEYSAFQKIYEQELVGTRAPDVYSYANNMVKLLGTPSSSGLGNVNDSDMKYIQDILKLHASTKVLHSQVFLQSMQYQDTSFVALTGQFDANVHNPLNYVHPVVAALFIPKIQSLEDTLLRANMANIVRTRYNSEPFTNVADTKLYFDLINDPNDIVCDTRSAVVDVLNRCTVQSQLWNSVLNLRNGQYFGAGFREFINGVDMCKLNRYDNPDLVYGRYDGTIIKRLLSVFSFRPTLVACSPVFSNNFSTNPYQNNVRPVVTSVPMINLRLVPSNDNQNNDSGVSLETALSQHQLLVENGQMVMKHTSLIFSNDILFFYVDRRSNTINLNDLRPYNITKQPTAISGFERINTAAVNVNEILKVRDIQYKLRSVVLSEVNSSTTEGNLVIGSSALICDDNDTLSTNYYYYNPMGVVKGYNKNGALVRESPVLAVPFTAGVGERDEYSFSTMARTRGIIYMYQARNVNVADQRLNV